MASALPYLPRHREARGRRASSITLDTLFDEGRTAAGGLEGGAFDFVLQAYRWVHAFRAELKEFSSKKPKPPQVEDLLNILYAALLTRTETPAAALVSEAVALTRSRLKAPHAAGFVNAFGRRVASRAEALRDHAAQHPDSLLGPALAARWNGHAVATQAGRLLQERPESGIASFDGAGVFARRPVAAFATTTLQAMDPGSWRLIDWIVGKLAERGSPFSLLDACAAPGGKTLALRVRLGDRARIVATESDAPRLERLRSNLRRWNFESTVPAHLVAWGRDESAAPTGPFDVILADLPCTGSGTLATRPDILLTDIGERLESLMPEQNALFASLRKRLAPGGSLFVSICSVDPAEIANISRLVGHAPDFSSWTPEANDEGLTAWHFVA